MGADIEGVMIVGNDANGFDYPAKYGSYMDFIEASELDIMYESYDSRPDRQYFGFKVDGIPIKDIHEKSKWLEDVREKAKRFEELTGLEAKLIGTQDIC